MIDNERRRYNLAHDEPYKDLEIVRKFDTASLTIKDIWELKERAYQEGYRKGRLQKKYLMYGLED